MKLSEILKSKTIAAGVLLILKGVYDMYYESNYESGIQYVLEGLAFIGIKHAIVKGKK